MTAAKVSAGLLMYSYRAGDLQVFLVHPGGPFWANKDFGAWSLPKGEVDGGEDLLSAAVRETTEETGIVAVPPFLPLGETRQKSGKVVHAWAFAGRWAPGTSIRSNPFEIEWPPRSGKLAKFPEVDRGEMFSVAEARRKLNPAQVVFVDRLQQRLAST